MTISKQVHDAALQAERDKTEAATAKYNALQAEGRRAEFTAYVAELPCDPAVKEGMVDFMAALDSGVVFEFSAADGSKRVVDPVAWFKSFSARIPSSVAVGSEDDEGGVDGDDAEALAAAAIEFQDAEAAAGRTISVSAAMQHVIKGGVK